MLQVAIEIRCAAQPALGPERDVRDDAAALPAEARIQPLGVAAADGVQHQHRPARLARCCFDGLHQRGTQATAAGAAMHLYRGKVRAVRLAVGHRQDELHRADDGVGSHVLGHQHDALAACGTGQDTFPERNGLVVRQRVHEPDGRAGLDAVQRHVSQRLGGGRVGNGAADADAVRVHCSKIRTPSGQEVSQASDNSPCIPPTAKRQLLAGWRPIPPRSAA